MRIQLDIIRGREPPQVVTWEALSVEDASLRAQREGYTVLAIKPHGQSWLMRLMAPFGSSTPAGSLAHKQTRAELAIFIEQLHALLVAGLSIIEALTTLERGARGVWPRIIEKLSHRLREGYTLSQAMSSLPDFPELLIALVHASEWTSDLPKALSRFLEHEKRAAEVRHQLKSVALYPALLTVVGSAVLLFLLLYVMPRFARVFEGMNTPLPISARLMILWSHAMRTYGVEIGGAVVIILLLGATLLGLPTYRTALLQRILAWPILERHLQVYFLARWYRATGMLVEGGIAFPQALALAINVLPSALRDRGQRVRKALDAGLAPSQAYIEAQMATPVAEQLLRAGERSGEVGMMLGRIAQFHEAEVTRSLEQALRILEPLIMAGIGIGVGAIVVLMYMPIFELASAIQ